jgi:hypothetical protein
MVHDLWEMDPAGTDPTPGSFGGNPDVDGFMSDGAYGMYGYPNPVLTARAQAAAAKERGEEPPMTPERIAHDIYFYESERHRADHVRYAFPSFEERYGYPDPRPKLPEDEQPAAWDA